MPFASTRNGLPLHHNPTTDPHDISIITWPLLLTLAKTFLRLLKSSKLPNPISSSQHPTWPTPKLLLIQRLPALSITMCLSHILGKQNLVTTYMNREDVLRLNKAIPSTVSICPATLLLVPLETRNQFAAFEVAIPLAWETIDPRPFHEWPLKNDESGSPPTAALADQDELPVKLFNGSWPPPEVTWKFTKDYFCRVQRHFTTKLAKFEEEINSFNESKSKFFCWPTTFHIEPDESIHWIMVVDVAHAPDSFPPVGDRCQIRFRDTENNFSDDDHGEETAKRVWHRCFGIQNPSNKVELVRQDWENYASFQVSIQPSKDGALHLAIQDQVNNILNPESLQIDVSKGTGTEAVFEREYSTTTLDIELTGLATAESAPATGRLGQAFASLMNFEEPSPESNVDTFELYPHMRSPEAPSSPLPHRAKDRYLGLDDD